MTANVKAAVLTSIRKSLAKNHKHPTTAIQERVNKKFGVAVDGRTIAAVRRQIKPKRVTVDDATFIKANFDGVKKGESMQQTADRLGIGYQQFIVRRTNINKQITKFNKETKATHPLLPVYPHGKKGQKKDVQTLVDLIKKFS
jgi:hypothetical protein